jgi:hypothetical protein
VTAIVQLWLDLWLLGDSRNTKPDATLWGQDFNREARMKLDRNLFARSTIWPKPLLSVASNVHFNDFSTERFRHRNKVKDTVMLARGRSADKVGRRKNSKGDAKRFERAQTRIQRQIKVAHRRSE